MHITLKLFIIGAIIGFIIGLTPFPGEIPYGDDPENYFKQAFAVGATLWKTVYFMITVFTLPFLVIEPLSRRLSVRKFLPLPFLAGNGVSLAVLTLTSMIYTLF